MIHKLSVLAEPTPTVPTGLNAQISQFLWPNPTQIDMAGEGAYFAINTQTDVADGFPILPKSVLGFVSVVRQPVFLGGAFVEAQGFDPVIAHAVNDSTGGSSDGSGIYRVLLTYSTKSTATDGQWQVVDLYPQAPGSGTYVGTVAASGPVEYYVQLLGLQPDTTYYFRPLGGVAWPAQGLWRQATAPTVQPGSPLTVYGRVLSGAQPATGAIVTVTLLGSMGPAAPLAGLVEASGYWHANLGNVRSADLARRLTMSLQDSVLLQATNGSAAVRSTAAAAALASGIDLSLAPASLLLLTGQFAQPPSASGQRAVPATITLYPPGESFAPGAQLSSWEVRADASGQFAVGLAGVSGGSYDLVVKRAASLGLRRRGQQVPAVAPLIWEPLTFGDVDEDDAVRWQDFELLAAQFRLREGGAGYDGRPDLNGDSQVTILDFSLLAGHYGQRGPLEVQ